MKKTYDLSKLSKEEKLQLLDALEEKQRRIRLGKPPYKPHDGQLIVHQSKALERYIMSGNGYGKSTMLVNEVHAAATGYNPWTGEHTPVPSKMVLLLDTPEKIDDFIMEYRKWNTLEERQLHKKGKANYCFITWDTGSTLTVLTHEVGDLKLEGSQWSHIFADEPPPRKVFNALFRGGRIKGKPLRTLLAGTPITAAWLRTDVYEPWSKGELPDVECFKGDSEANRANLEEGYLARFAAKLSDKEKRIRLHGEFFDLEGLALAHLFRRSTHTVARSALDWKESNPCVLVIDPHPSKAHHAVILGADRDNYLYVLEEFKEKAIARHFMEGLIANGIFERYRIQDIVYDSLGSGDGTGGEGFKSFGAVINEVLAEAGYGRARATTYAEKDDEAWISRIQEALVLPEEANNFGQRIPKLRVVSSCTGCIADIENVAWARDKRLDENKPKLDITNKDFLSCIKYALATNIYYKKRKESAFYRKKNVYGFSAKPAADSAKPKVGRMRYLRPR